MLMKKRIQIILVSCLLIVVSFLIYINYQIEHPRFISYTNQMENYSIKIPFNWAIQEQSKIGNSEDQVVAETGGADSAQLGNLVSIAILVAAPNSKEPLTTQKEFATLYNKKSEKITYDKLQKVKNIQIAGKKAIILSDTNLTPTVRGWNYIVWFMKNNKNYYIQFLGNSKFENSSWNDIKTIISSFTFN